MEIRCAAFKKRTIKSISLLIGGVGLIFVLYQLLMAQFMEETENVKMDVHGIVHNRKIINLKRSRIVVDSDGDYFVCGDGIRISHSKLNDDYCDCADGSDEPDTDACSGMTHFECHVRFKKFKIPSGWVNDGICDCCDGSDERNTKSHGLISLSLEVQMKMGHFLSPCPNTCPK